MSIEAPGKENIIWTGWLEKRGPTISYRWRNRFVVLGNDTIYYYADDAQKELKGTIPLKPKSVLIVFTDPKAIGDAIKHVKERPYGFVCDNDPDQGKNRRLYYFDAVDEPMLKEFMDAFKKAASSVKANSSRASKLLIGGLYGSLANASPAPGTIQEEDQDTQTASQKGKKARAEIKKKEDLQAKYAEAKQVVPKSKQTGMEKPPPVPKIRMMRATCPTGEDGAADLSGELGNQRKLSDGVDMYTLKDNDSFKFTYSIANWKLAILSFTLDASGSTNVKSDELGDSLKITKEVQPSCYETLGSLARDDPSAGAGTSMSFSWTFKPVDKAAVMEAEADKIGERNALAEQMRNNGILASELGSAEAIIAKLQEAGIDSFVDAEFFPDDSALFNDPSNSANAPVVFRRAKEFIEGGSPCVFDGDIKPGDIKQGALGNCWFLASIAALAEFPEDLIRPLFVTDQSNDFGVFEVKCFKNGKETRVIVDDYFPCQPGTGKPCYSRSAGDELWVMLLEKAWAKLHGSYEQIESGTPLNALMDLSGAFGESHHFAQCGSEIESGTLYEKLRGYDVRKYVMCAGTPGNDDMTKAERDKLSGGIVPGHAYTLKSVKEAEGNKLLQLRNPWGRFEWDGDWSDKSELWTDSMKDAIQPGLSAEDGQFWMAASDFFASYTDCNCVDAFGRTGARWKDSRTSFTTSPEDVCSQVFYIDVPEGATGYLGLCQQDERIRGAPEYSTFCFALFGPCDDNGIPAKECTRSPSWNCRQISKELPTGLEPGKYLTVIYNPNKVEVPVTFVTLLDADGLEAASVEQGEFTQELKDSLILATLINGDSASRDDYQIFELVRSWLPGNGYAVAAKSKHSGNVSVTLNFGGCSGLVLEGSDEMEVAVELEPEADDYQLVAVLKPTASSIGFGMSLSYSYF